MAGQSRDLAYSVYVTDEHGSVVHFSPGEEVPDWAAEQITNPDAWVVPDQIGRSQGPHLHFDAGDGGEDLDDGDGEEDEAEVEEDSPVDYSALSKTDLEAEVTDRNSGRSEDEVIVVEGRGNKPDLIAALEADDASQAESSGD